MLAPALPRPLDTEAVPRPPASGKTAALIDRAGNRYSVDPFAPTRVIVPTVRHADQFRRRLVDSVGSALDLSVDTFDTFVRRRVAAGSVAARDVTDALLRRVLASSATSPSYLSPIADAPGTLSFVREAIRVLIAEEIDADDFEPSAAAAGLPELVALADLYRSYVRELEELSLRGDICARCRPDRSTSRSAGSTSVIVTCRSRSSTSPLCSTCT